MISVEFKEGVFRFGNCSHATLARGGEIRVKGMSILVWDSVALRGVSARTF